MTEVISKVWMSKKVTERFKKRNLFNNLNLRILNLNMRNTEFRCIALGYKLGTHSDSFSCVPIQILSYFTFHIYLLFHRLVSRKSTKLFRSKRKLHKVSWNVQEVEGWLLGECNCFRHCSCCTADESVNIIFNLLIICK